MITLKRVGNRSEKIGLLMMASLLVLAGCDSDKSTAVAPPAESAQEETATSPQAETPNTNAEAERFASMMNRHAEMFLANSPEVATQLGLPEDIAGTGYQSRLSNYDFGADQTARSHNEDFLIELKSVSREALPANLALSYDILREAYEMGARRNQFEFGSKMHWGSSSPYRVTQLTGAHLFLPRLLQTQQPLNTAGDIEPYLARLSGMATAFDGVAQMVRTDAELGVVAPAFALQGAAGSIKSFVSLAPEDSPLVTIFSDKIAKIDGIDGEAVQAFQLRAAEIVRDDVYPALSRMETTLSGLIPLSTEGSGVWRLGPQGEEFYQHALDSFGGQGRTGEEIHELGLAEVARITAEMETILQAEGYGQGSVAERMDAIGKLPDSQYPNTDAGRETLLGDLNVQVDEIMAKADQWFGTLPEQAVEVRRIPVYEQDTSPGGYYTGPPLDGSRPGIYWINLKNTADWPKLSLKTLTYHEAVPGHHFQISLQRAIDDMPLIRNMMGFSEFSEGWALYSEKVAAEMGMYDEDPFGNLGRLQSELFRAARLVVDSGLHYKRWTREEAIDYMVNVTGNTRASMTREVERYAVWPGQATSYKLGMLKMEELRARAQAELGEAFDIREFHDEILLPGAMPLPVLDARINSWIASRKGS